MLLIAAVLTEVSYFFSDEWISRFQVISSFLLMLFTLLYLVETRKMVLDQRKRIEKEESPAISLRIDVEHKNSPNLSVIMKNSGGGAAYDVSVTFDPDIPYNETTLSNLNMFNKMPLLDKGEKVKFFLDTAPNYLNSDKPKLTTARIEYYDLPSHERNKNLEPHVKKIDLDITEREGQLQLKERSFDDLVREVEELKETLLMIYTEKEEGNKNED